MWTYDTLDNDRNEIRLLTLLSGPREEPPQCELYAVSLDEHPAFEAVSYVWGDPTTTKTITVNQSSRSVTENLYNVLVNLRANQTQNRTLWVDALCINQESVPEKNVQVRKMAEIYTKAKQVAVMLEPMTEETEVAISWRQALKVRQSWGSRQVPSWPNVDHWLRWMWVDVQALFSKQKQVERYIKMPKVIQGNFDLKAQPYWGRMWTFQEFLLPEQLPILYFGDRQLPSLEAILLKDAGGILSEAVVKLIASIPKLDETDNERRVIHEHYARIDAHKPLEMGPDSVEFVLMNRWSRHKPNTPALEAVDTVMPTLSISLERRCLDPRDRFYALYGLLPELEAAFPLDYSRTKEDVEHGITVFLIEFRIPYRMESLIWEMFGLRYNNLDSASLSDLPSWVPDYYRQDDLAESRPVFAFGQTVTHTLTMPSNPGLKSYLSDDRKTLHLSARHLGSCSIALRFSHENSDIWDQLRNIVRIFSRRGIATLIPVVWMLFGRSLQTKLTTYTPTALEAALRRLLSKMWNDIPHYFTGPAELQIHAGVEWLAGKTLLKTADSKSLWWTGVGNAAARDGDHVVLPPGGRLAVILRPAKDRPGSYRMAGTARIGEILVHEGLEMNKGFVDAIQARPLELFNII